MTRHANSKAQRTPKRGLPQDSFTGDRASALAPPAYGIEFVDRPPNRTGLPDHVKAGIESLSGMDLSDVKVHANSAKPAELDALAYAQGSEIHVAPGQEQHLAHEAWHVVQQRQGRVKPTLEVKGEPINHNVALEREADVMGDRALRLSQPVQAIAHAKGCGCHGCSSISAAIATAPAMQAKAAGSGGIGVIQLNCKYCGSPDHTNKNCPLGPGGNPNKGSAPTGKRKPKSTDRKSVV